MGRTIRSRSESCWRALDGERGVDAKTSIQFSQTHGAIASPVDAATGSWRSCEAQGLSENAFECAATGRARPQWDATACGVWEQTAPDQLTVPDSARLEAEESGYGNVPIIATAEP